MSRLCAVDFDRPETYLLDVDAAVAGVLSSTAYSQLTSLRYKYIDDAARQLSQLCNLSELFFAIQSSLQSRKLLVHHATRLSECDYQSLTQNGFCALLETQRISALESRLKEYAESQGLQFCKTRFEKLVAECKNRDHGAVYFSLSKRFHLADCTEYLHFGSEFEAVVVVHMFGRHARPLLKVGTTAAFVTWEIDAEHAYDQLSYYEIEDYVEGGNYPEFANHFLNPWLLWKTNRVEDINYLDPDFTLTFRRPFPEHSQSIRLVSDLAIAPYAR